MLNKPYPSCFDNFQLSCIRDVIVATFDGSYCVWKPHRMYATFPLYRDF